MMNLTQRHPRRPNGRLAMAAAVLMLSPVVHAQMAATPEQHFPDGYLESVASGYQPGVDAQVPALAKMQTPATTVQAATNSTRQGFLQNASYPLPQRAPGPHLGKKRQP
ncbi:MAG: hypothetical protein JSV72_21230 [Ralstonia sp.]|nr:MAG: hypothetical protein JSV72_21230 [Ralstonia sp.]